MAWRLRRASPCHTLLLLASRLLLLAGSRFLAAGRRLLLAGRRLLLTGRCLLLADRCLLLADRCLLLRGGNSRLLRRRLQLRGRCLGLLLLHRWRWRLALRRATLGAGDTIGATAVCRVAAPTGVAIVG